MKYVQALGTRAYEASRTEAAAVSVTGVGANSGAHAEERLSADHQLLCQIGNCLQLNAVSQLSRTVDMPAIPLVLCKGLLGTMGCSDTGEKIVKGIRRSHSNFCVGNIHDYMTSTFRAVHAEMTNYPAFATPETSRL